jgi:hypothetical protein
MNRGNSESLLTLQVLEVSSIEKKPIACCRGSQADSLYVTLGKQLNNLEIYRVAVMWLCMEMILIRDNSFHTIMRMSRAKVEWIHIGY